VKTIRIDLLIKNIFKLHNVIFLSFKRININLCYDCSIPYVPFFVNGFSLPFMHVFLPVSIMNVCIFTVFSIYSARVDLFLFVVIHARLSTSISTLNNDWDSERLPVGTIIYEYRYDISTHYCLY
jgi:hypothetical protein